MSLTISQSQRECGSEEYVLVKKKTLKFLQNDKIKKTADNELLNEQLKVAVEKLTRRESTYKYICGCRTVMCKQHMTYDQSFWDCIETIAKEMRSEEKYESN